jgi:DNA-binding NtrC family response regulator
MYSGISNSAANQGFPDRKIAVLRLHINRIKAVNRAFAEITAEPVERNAPAEGGVLIIEDCEPLLFYLNSALLTLGYQEQFLASTLAEAYAAWSQHKESISTVLLNYELPDGRAFEFASLILRERSDVNIIITTGYDVAAIRDSNSNSGDLQFLQKPFRLSELKDMLEAASPARMLAV